MKISSVRVVSYASFRDSGRIDLSPKINVIVGENNSGKSALLSAMRPQLSNKPHRSPDRYLPAQLENSRVELDITVSTSEIRRRMAATNQPLLFPVPNVLYNNPDAVRSYLNEEHDLSFKCFRTTGSGLQPQPNTFFPLSSEPSQFSLSFRILASTLTFISKHVGDGNSLGSLLDDTNIPGTYYFAAQRLSIGTAPISDAKLLSENAANLPNVLAYLQGSRRQIFEEIQQRVREVLPSVGSIAVTPSGGTHRILVRTDSLSSEEELAFDLDECGTGVAQVIAILTAAISSKESVIIVDEINSFLHPAAVKRLISLFKFIYNGNQYIISTHSSDTIAAAGSDSVIFVEREQYQSEVRRIDASDVQAMRLAARRLGISMLDVFGFDSVMWVEGPTEEQCFRAVIAFHAIQMPGSIAIASVPATGDFTRKSSTKPALLKVFEETANALAPLSGAMSFALDRDNASDDAVQSVLRSTDGKLRLLPRYCIENYLLHPLAISRVIEESADIRVDPSLIRDAIVKYATIILSGKSRSVKTVSINFDDNDWKIKVDGAKLMKSVFDDVTAARLAYRKVDHGKLIVEAILKIDPSYLAELKNFIIERLEKTASLNPNR